MKTIKFLLYTGGTMLLIACIILIALDTQNKLFEELLQLSKYLTFTGALIALTGFILTLLNKRK